MSDVRKFKEFGWRMLEFEVPESWEISVDSKGKDYAYFRLDYVYPRLEVKWEKISKKRPPSLKTSVEEYLKEMEKKAKKSGAQYKLVNLREVKVMSHPALSFYVRSSGETLGVCWCCPDTERLVLLQLIFRPEEYHQMYPIFKRLLRTIRCHKKGPWLWYFYGLYVRIPQEYELEDHKFTPAFSKVKFKKEDMGLIVAYHNIANVVLEEYRSVDGWFKNFCKPRIFEDLGSLKLVNVESFSINGHDGRKYIYKSRFSFFKKLLVLSFSWLCNASNRLINLTFYLPEKMYSIVSEEIEEILYSSKCH
ncbi:MAG: hypothetical protein DRZ82_06375 [Thermoprotei archaeon]|nr:MAG: hypothetical protein DRZ82_06375 [Thermoprotei archaeon]